MKISEERKELFRQIMEVCMEINECAVHEVFVQYSPHVRWLDIDVFYGGWTSGAHADLNMKAYLYDEENSNNSMKMALDRLNRIKEGEMI